MVVVGSMSWYTGKYAPNTLNGVFNYAITVYSTVYITVFVVFHWLVSNRKYGGLRNRLHDNGSGVSSDILAGCSSIMEIDIASVGITNFWSFLKAACC
jgi:hypothetical protein